MKKSGGRETAPAALKSGGERTNTQLQKSPRPEHVQAPACIPPWMKKKKENFSMGEGERKEQCGHETAAGRKTSVAMALPPPPFPPGVREAG